MQEKLYLTADAGETPASEVSDRQRMLKSLYQQLIERLYQAAAEVFHPLQETLFQIKCLSADRCAEEIYQTADAGISIPDSGCRSLLRQWIGVSCIR